MSDFRNSPAAVEAAYDFLAQNPEAIGDDLAVDLWAAHDPYEYLEAEYEWLKERAAGRQRDEMKEARAR